MTVILTVAPPEGVANLTKLSYGFQLLVRGYLFKQVEQHQLGYKSMTKSNMIIKLILTVAPQEGVTNLTYGGHWPHDFHLMVLFK